LQTTPMFDKLYHEWSKITSTRTERELALESENESLTEDCASYSVRLEELSGIIKKLKLEVEALTYREFRVGDRVLVYDRFRFTGKPQFATVLRVDGILYGIEVEFTQGTGDPVGYPIGSKAIVCKEQLKHE